MSKDIGSVDLKVAALVNILAVAWRPCSEGYLANPRL
jgi:hypothetical protein